MVRDALSVVDLELGYAQPTRQQIAVESVARVVGGTLESRALSQSSEKLVHLILHSGRHID